MLELLDSEFKTTMIHMLRALRIKQTACKSNVSRDKETLRKNQKEMLEIKNNVIKKKKKHFDRLISRLDMAEERI